MSAGLEAHLGYWLRRVSNNVSGTFQRALLTQQVSVAEWVALRLIEERRNISPGELADAMSVTRGAVSKVLDKLAARKWIARATKTEDSRGQSLSLTAQGHRYLPKLTKIADDNDENFFACLTAGEQAMLRQLLQKLTESHRLDSVPMD